MAKDSARNAGKHPFIVFLTTLPGILTGIASVIGAVAGFYALKANSEDSQTEDAIESVTSNIEVDRRASKPVTTYTARLSDKDHKNKEGFSLVSPLQIIRWDRVNYHNQYHRDDEDTNDSMFELLSNRSKIDTLFKAAISPKEARTILNRQPIVSVTVWSDKAELKIIDEGPPL
ncbi:MAG: hypothetical protein QNJ97_26170 [Myxococcota bacterium]|nr:hypothetical protein [Myxococcota bacterium]